MARKYVKIINCSVDRPCLAVMTFSSTIRALQRLPLTEELLNKLNQQQLLQLTGLGRLPKGIVASTLAQAENRPLLIVTSTLEEAGRWAAQMEAMGWQTMHFYPTSESSPYEPFDAEAEMVWGQLQVLADLAQAKANESDKSLAIVATERALQPHLPPLENFLPYCVNVAKGMEIETAEMARSLAKLGYEKVSLVETEGQWSQRGDIIDVFPVASELPVRLELFGDELELIREFDPTTQRTLDRIEQMTLTPTSFTPVIDEAIRADKLEELSEYLSDEELELFESGQTLEGMRRFLGLAFDRPASFFSLPVRNRFSKPT